MDAADPRTSEDAATTSSGDVSAARDVPRPARMGHDCEVHHPGVQHSALLAKALNSRGRLRHLVTRLQVGGEPERWAIRVALGNRRVARALQARTDDALADRAIVRVHPGDLAVERLVARSPLRERAATPVARALSGRFARAAAARVHPATRFVVCTDHDALPSFVRLAASRPSVVRVLDVAHPFAAASSRFVREDAEEHGFPVGHYDDRIFSDADLDDAREELRLADRILVASQFTASTLPAEGVGPERVSVIPYGFPPTTPVRSGDDRRSEPDPHLELVFIGALSERKGITLLLRALAETHARRLPVHLTIIGRPAAGYVLPALAESSACTYLGRVSDAHLAAALARAHHLVLPSICEGFGRVLVEALGAGAGVITTERSAAPDLLADHPDAPIVVTPVAERDRLADVLEAVQARVATEGVDTAAARGVAAALTVDRYADRLDLALQAPDAP